MVWPPDAALSTTRSMRKALVKRGGNNVVFTELRRTYTIYLPEKGKLSAKYQPNHVTQWARRHLAATFSGSKCDINMRGFTKQVWKTTELI